MLNLPTLSVYDGGANDADDGGSGTGSAFASGSCCPVCPVL